MREQEYEILMLKPRWTFKGIVFERSPAENKNSIIYQLKNQYISQGWQLADDIGWGKEHRFAVVKLRRPIVRFSAFDRRERNPVT